MGTRGHMRNDPRGRVLGGWVIEIFAPGPAGVSEKEGDGDPPTCLSTELRGRTLL